MLKMKIPLDKQAHFLAGTTICLAVSLFFSPLIGLAAAVFAGMAKEVWDSMGFGTADRWDFVATAAGGVVGYVLIMIKGVVL